MILVDKKILAGGSALFAAGIITSLYLVSITPVGQAGMSEDEIAEFLLAERENEDYSILAGILTAVGFLLVLVSFGARRRRGAAALKKEKKPVT